MSQSNNQDLQFHTIDPVNLKAKITLLLLSCEERSELVTRETEEISKLTTVL